MRGGANKWKWEKCVAIFPKNWYCTPPPPSPTPSSATLHLWRIVDLHLTIVDLALQYFFPLLLCISRENRIKLKKILNLNHKLKWNKLCCNHSSVQRIKIVHSSELTAPNFLICLFKFTYVCTVDVWTFKTEFFFEKIRNYSQPLNL